MSDSKTGERYNHDETKSLSNSLIQHGDYNDRVYLMKLSEKDNKQRTIEKVIDLAKSKNYGKVFAKVNAKDSDLLKQYNFECEAKIPGFFKGEEDGEFHSLFLSEDRKNVNFDVIQKNLKLAKKKQGAKKKVDFEIVELGKENVGDITELYSKVFNTYPFPIFDEKFVADCLENHVRIFGIVEDDNDIIALSSCEIDYESKNVEMTDFATLPNQRTKGFAQGLLSHMENEMKDAEIKTAYTIARALSLGINITFSKCNYTYGGTLKKNTNISGGIESMNVWYKSLVERT